jgi:hypothetical protein
MPQEVKKYEDIIKNDESLALFLATLAEFDRAFCDRMFAGDDFNLAIEVHGNRGEIIHCRTKIDGFKRPRGADKRIETKMKRVG